MSNWNAGHTPYHYPTPLLSPTPRTPHYPPPSAQWPPASAGPPSIVSLESRRSYGTAPSYVPSRPYIPTPPPAENGVDNVEQVYSPSVAASLGLSNYYGSRSTYDRAPTPEDEIFIPPSPTPSERKDYDSEARKRALDHARARGIPPSSYALGALTPYQRSQYDLDPPAYRSMNSSSMLPTLPSPAPSDSGVMVYVGSNGGLAPDVTITAGPYETVVQIKHRPHREERRGDRRHRS